MATHAALPMLQLPSDAEAFVGAVVSDARVRWLGQQFRPGSTSLDKISRHLLREAARLTAGERNQVRRVVRHWASESPAPTPTGHPALDELRRLAQNWDFRLGGERDDIPTGADLLPADVSDVVEDLARDWGQSCPGRAEGDYNAVVIIGGMVRANLNRSRAVAESIQRRDVRTRAVIGLAAQRIAGENERSLGSRLGVPAATEEESLLFSICDAFDVPQGQWTDLQAPTGRLLRHNWVGQPALLVGSVPESASGQRANTDESYRWLVANEAPFSPGRILSVTSPIYWIANHISALVEAPDGFLVHTAGLEPSQMPGELNQPFFGQHYLQEQKSALDALARLLAWAERRGA